MSREAEYFTLDMLEKFIYAIPKWVKTLERKPIMTPFAMQTMFLIDYYTCIRPYSELMRLRKPDFNLETQMLHATNMKKGLTKTTIPKTIIPILDRYLDEFSDTEQLFQGTHKTFHNWVKAIGNYAGISYSEEFKIRSIEGMYLYIFKHAYTQRLEQSGCPPSYISIKDRHSVQGMARTTTNYSKSIRGLIAWENNNITEKWSI